jgi:6-phosphofructokinase 1
MRSGSPDSLDRVVGLAFGNLAYQCLTENRSGVMTAVVDAKYRAVPLDRVQEGARPANIHDYYDREEYRPRLTEILGKSLLLA